MYKSTIVRTIVSIVLIVASFIVEVDVWKFALRLWASIFAYIVLFRVKDIEGYKKDVFIALNRKMDGQLHYEPKELKEKDWHSMVLIPALIIAFGSGFFLSPYLCFDAEFGWADVVSSVAGPCIFFIAEGGFPMKEYKELVNDEAENLFWKVKRNG